MSLIRQWIATNPPDADDYTSGWEPRVLNAEKSAQAYRGLGWRVIEVVPAEQLQGAVEARDDLNNIIAMRAASPQAALSALDDVIRKRRAAAAAGGQ